MDKTFLCMRCYETFVVDNYFGDTCPRSKCGSIRMFEIDEAILETIIILNQKCYETSCCCSGHISGSNIYIGFHPQLENFLLNNAPSGFELITTSNRKNTGISYSIPREASYSERMRLFSDKNIELYNWASSLPIYRMVDND